MVDMDETARSKKEGSKDQYLLISLLINLWSSCKDFLAPGSLEKDQMNICQKVLKHNIVLGV